MPFLVGGLAIGLGGLGIGYMVNQTKGIGQDIEQGASGLTKLLLAGGLLWVITQTDILKG